MKKLFLVVLTRKHENQEYVHCVTNNYPLALLMGEHHVICRANKYNFKILVINVKNIEPSYHITSHNSYGIWQHIISGNPQGESLSLLTENDFSLNFLQDFHSNIDFFSNSAKEALRNITESYLRKNL